MQLQYLSSLTWSHQFLASSSTNQWPYLCWGTFLSRQSKASTPSRAAVILFYLQVNLVSEHIWCEDFLVRSFYLKNVQTNETRTVTQFHFLSWMDQNVPESARTLLDFRRCVNVSFYRVEPRRGVSLFQSFPKFWSWGLMLVESCRSYRWVLE